MKFTVTKADKFGWEGVKGWSVRINAIASTSYLEIESSIPLRKNSKNNRVYLVVEGKVDFRVNGTEYNVCEKEAIFIPKNTKYSYKSKGKVKMVELNAPAFAKESEVVL